MVICGVNKTHTQKVIVANRLNLFASKLLMRGNTWSFFNTNIFPVTKTKQNIFFYGAKKTKRKQIDVVNINQILSKKLSNTFRMNYSSYWVNKRNLCMLWVQFW